MKATTEMGDAHWWFHMFVFIVIIWDDLPITLVSCFLFSTIVFGMMTPNDNGKLAGVKDN